MNKKYFTFLIIILIVLIATNAQEENLTQSDNESEEVNQSLETNDTVLNDTIKSNLTELNESIEQLNLSLKNETIDESLNNNILINETTELNESIEQSNLILNDSEEIIEEFKKSYIIEFKKDPILKKFKDNIEKSKNEISGFSIFDAYTIKDTGIKTYENELKNEHLMALLDIEETINNETVSQITSMTSLKLKIHPFFKKLKEMFIRITGYSVLSREVQPSYEYYNVLNGIVLELTPTEVENIKKSKYVKGVYPDLEVNTTLMDSVPLINADVVWQFDNEGTNCIESGNACLTGNGITIAIIDTGVDYTHEDLGGCFGKDCKVIGGYDFINKDSDPIDDHGHGTHVAATAAGNGKLKGVAPDAKILAYKVLSKYGSGSYSAIISGIERATDPNQDLDFSDRADILSMSLAAYCYGGYTTSCGPEDTMSRAVDNAVDAGVIAVIAAANNGGGQYAIGSPGTARKAITVAATDKNNLPASFSSRGPVIWNGEDLEKPDLSAPGVSICAAEWDSAWNYSKCFDDKHVAISGTSMATPHVAGAAAILKQKNPTLTPTEVKEILKSGTIEIKYYDYNTVGTGRIDLIKILGFNSTLPECSQDSDCSDKLYCNGIEKCKNSRCTNDTQPTLSDGVTCTIDICNETTDLIVHTPNNTFCNNQLYCDGIETCNSNLGCVPGIPPNLSDNISCTADTCDEVNDNITHTPNNGVCNDGLFCNGIETCDSKKGCIFSTNPINCNDSLSCTFDSCNEATKSCTSNPIDLDNDKFSICQGKNFDCDDNDSNISPEAIERCNRIDDNCNNRIDEDISIPCEKTLGVCAGSIKKCKFGTLVECTIQDYDSHYEITELNCKDNKDNDCDGKTDIIDEDCFDSDLDGVLDKFDKCPNTIYSLRNIVNNLGCPKPKTSKWEIFSDINNSDLSNLTKFEIGKKDLGKILYSDFINLNKENKEIDFDSYINISQHKVEIKTEELPSLNKSATIILYNVTLKSPMILKDGNECKECKIISWNNETKIIEFTVEHFTTYELVESEIEELPPEELPIDEQPDEGEPPLDELPPDEEPIDEQPDEINNETKKGSSGGGGGSSSSSETIEFKGSKSYKVEATNEETVNSFVINTECKTKTCELKAKKLENKEIVNQYYNNSKYKLIDVIDLQQCNGDLEPLKLDLYLNKTFEETNCNKISILKIHNETKEYLPIEFCSENNEYIHIKTISNTCSYILILTELNKTYTQPLNPTITDSTENRITNLELNTPKISNNKNLMWLIFTIILFIICLRVLYYFVHKKK